MEEGEDFPDLTGDGGLYLAMDSFEDASATGLRRYDSYSFELIAANDLRELEPEMAGLAFGAGSGLVFTACDVIDDDVVHTYIRQTP